MSLDPLITAPIEIQFHASAAMLALITGPVALYRRRRDALHKTLGYLWVLAMLVTALSSFAIHGFPVIGPFSPIHLLALFTLWSLFEAMRAVFAGDIRHHEAVMRSLYWNGLIIAGLFNFLPGRAVNRMVFGQAETLGWYVIALGATALLWRAFGRRSLRPVAV